MFPVGENEVNNKGPHLNESSDFVTIRNLYHQSWGGYVNPVDLFDPTDPNSVIYSESWLPRFVGISDRLDLNDDGDLDDSTDFPMLFGDTIIGESNVSVGFVLIPVLPAP